jgi:hypothetical protein
MRYVVLVNAVSIDRLKWRLIPNSVAVVRDGRTQARPKLCDWQQHQGVAILAVLRKTL